MSDLRYTAKPAAHTEIPRTKRGEGQWALGYREPFASLEEGVSDYVRRFLSQADPYR